MSDFILKKRDFDGVPNLLTQEAPGFAESGEFKALEEQERGVPGLVCAAFTKYFVRLQKAESRTYASESERTALEQCYAVIKRLASSTDPAAKNLVVVEVFENISDPEALAEIEKRLKPKSLALYKRWIG